MKKKHKYDSDFFTRLRKMIYFENDILKRMQKGENFTIPIHLKTYMEGIIASTDKPIKGKITYITN